ncbi:MULTISPECIES: response regulator transcription factor [Clostridium]|uniref:Stage 0 sporulation protein A homolog n=2 Tax=Clostridium TaxID=1485 RepID=A0A0D1AM45_CLOBO|nr:MULTISPECIES: response regulator transcription factor [Clostridium]MBE6075521.1 response regulator transcription factor [Clostridium lundense]MDU1320857.1 response regulator transcription factor [Clostridium botulinum]EDU36478.1 response regulator receiver domain protein [Clostridium sporogenes ATCC 15579]KIS24194.1 PhoP family transcriptional regulator [Clostridium botulinum B2 450]MCW7998011.1 DNA-binding response regulator [Clostridium sp. cpc1]
MERIKILIVEDDININNMIKESLIKEGYDAGQAFHGLEAVEKFQGEEWHMVIMDVMMPVMDGIEAMRRIREKSKVSIIILSAKGEDSDKIIGLGMGADDYIVKPFSISELIARVKSNIRRAIYYNETSANNEDKIYQYGDIKFNMNKYIVTKGGKELALTAKEMKILKLFFENPNRVFTKVQIYDSVWGEEFLSDYNTVTVHMRRLRSKIEDDSNNPKLIETVWGIGYKLIGDR